MATLMQPDLTREAQTVAVRSGACITRGRLEFARRSSAFPPLSGRVEPLLSVSAESSGIAHFSGGSSCDESPAVARNKPKHPVRNLYQRSYAVVFVTLGIVVVMSAYQEVMLGVGIPGCDREALFQEKCEGALKAFVIRPLVFRQVLGYATYVYLLFSEVYATRICRRAVFEGRKMTQSTIQSSRTRAIVSGHWTAVASPDIFAEVAAMAAENQLLSLSLSGATTVLATATLARLQVAQSQGGIGDSASSTDTTYRYRHMARAVGFCCAPGIETWTPDQCSYACRAGLLAHSPFLVFCTGMLCCLICSVSFIPVKLWSPVTVKAVKTGKMPHMRRMLRLPTATATLAVFNIVSFFVNVVEMLELNVPIPGFWPKFWIAILCLDIAAALAYLGVVLSTVNWQHLAKRVKALICKASPYRSRVYSLWDPGMKAQRASLSWFGRGDAHSRRYRQLVLGACGLLAFGLGAIDSGSMTSPLELWITRIIIVLLLIFSRDQESDFEMLEDNGAGFGLVLDALQLRKLLECHLAGKQCQGRVKRYKGTLLRMCDTMSVSYRWQESSVKLEGLGELNMRNWQLESLVKAIHRSGCLYVWIDAFSVPQTNGELKRVLLSRMMAVYASSFVTVALLTCEEESERYHQRVWTLQEYCSSGQLIVAQEPDEGGVCGKQAVEEGEAALARQLRHEHMARQPWCVPMWLNSDLVAMIDALPPEADTRRIWKTYTILRDSLFCLYPEDSIRALYPLLWNRPAESQGEVIRLMELIETMHGIPAQDSQIGLLRSSSHRHFSDRFLLLDEPCADDIEAGELLPSTPTSSAPCLQICE